MLKPNDPFFLPSENESEHEIELSDVGTNTQEGSTTVEKAAGRQKGVKNRQYILQP